LSTQNKKIGVIGVGSFGTAIANLLALNGVDTLWYSRQPTLVQKIKETRKHQGITISDHIEPTADLEKIAANCDLIFPIIPSKNFRTLMQELGPYLQPYHILIHGTKGFGLRNFHEEALLFKETTLTRDNVCTMSEVIRQESVVVRIGCLAGPNLASEILGGQPTATVIASPFTEVIKKGKGLLNSRQFHVFGSHELLGCFEKCYCHWVWYIRRDGFGQEYPSHAYYKRAY